MKDPIKVAMGKKSKAKGMRFESKVRKDLESKGWIVDKWTNNVEFEPCKEGCNGCGKELCISCNVPKYSKHKENCSQTIRSGMWYFCKGECSSCSSNHSQTVRYSRDNRYDKEPDAMSANQMGGTLAQEKSDSGSDIPLSDKIDYPDQMNGGAVLYPEDVKEFIRRRNSQINDMCNDVLDLIEINTYGKEDLISKMKRLFIAHRDEIDKLAGDFK